MRLPAYSFDEATAVAAALEALACAPRLQLFTAIQQMGGASPIELIAAVRRQGCNLTQPTISHHLLKLAVAGLVTATRSGRTMTYRLTEYGQRAHDAVRAVR